MIPRQKTFSAALAVAAGLILLVTACGSSEPIGLDGGEPGSGGTAAAASATDTGAETQPGDAETQLASDEQVGEGESATGAESEQPAPDGAETASAETATGDAATAEEEAAQAGGAREEPESGAVAMAAAPPARKSVVRKPTAANALVPNEPAEEPEPADEPDDRPLGLAGTEGGSGPPGGGGGNGDESFLQRVLGAVSNVPG
ncbi:MAG: hypothetical protein V3S29_11605, partial [bacterium]